MVPLNGCSAIGSALAQVLANQLFMSLSLLIAGGHSVVNISNVDTVVPHCESVHSSDLLGACIDMHRHLLILETCLVECL